VASTRYYPVISSRNLSQDSWLPAEARTEHFLTQVKSVSTRLTGSLLRVLFVIEVADIL
jgi:hypothetical protein